jgi:hypothetical protein
MGIDVLTLIERDHRDLEQGLIDITRSPPDQARDILDGLRFGMVAHAGSEADILDSLLGEGGRAERLQFFVAQVLAAHRAQEREFDVLARMTPGTIAWNQRATALRDLVRQHDSHEQTSLMPALRACLRPEQYAVLAGVYATGRLCLLTMAPLAWQRHQWSQRSLKR